LFYLFGPFPPHPTKNTSQNILRAEGVAQVLSKYKASSSNSSTAKKINKQTIKTILIYM
jgi:hypothetical protein